MVMNPGSFPQLSPKQQPLFLLRVFSSFSSSSSSSKSHFPFLSPKLLKQCKTQLQATHVHQQIIIQGLTYHFTTNLISTYLALNSPSHALSLLQTTTPSPHLVYHWNALIRRAVSLKKLSRCFSLYAQMKRLSWSPDQYTYPFVLKACGELPSFRDGGSVHAGIVSNGFESNVFVCNAIVAMYGRCGLLEYARKMFDEMCERGVFDLVTWNSIVASYVQCGDARGAVCLFNRMCKMGEDEVWPDVISIVNVLPACAAIGAGERGREVHGFAVRSGLFEDVFVGNALVDMYAKCGMMSEAGKVFELMKEKDVVSWNTMVTGYSQIGCFEDALGLFRKMREANIELDVVSWSAVIAGYAQRGLGEKALDVFRQMQFSGSKPNQVTLVSVLSGCASLEALLLGKEIHCYAIKSMLGFGGNALMDDLLVVNGVIDMYAKCKSIELAVTLFSSVAPDDRGIVTWTTMIGGFAQHGEANDALELFSLMVKQYRSVRPNAFTISCALMACARLGALRYGSQIHAYVLRHQCVGDMLFVSNCLIDMYSKSGDIGAAKVVFDSMKQRNAVSWTSLVTAYGMHGRGEESLELFNKMREEGFMPDGVTFLVVLYACNHSGMIDLGIQYFSDMSKVYGVAPGEEHYSCAIDLLGRAGRLDEAMKLTKEMPMKPSPMVWVALLGSCRIHGNVELGEYAANQLLELKLENDGFYTLLSNIYANARRWKDVARIRSLMKSTGIRKRPGCSWVQGKKGTATFFVGDRTHPLTKQIYELLANLIQRIKVLGYVAQTCFALHDVDDEEKGDLLSEHSEKLALAYGILTSAPGEPIRISKNLRICGDCHNAMSYISMIVDHEIILRDSSRFHHFNKGSCSCRGYW